MARGVDGREVFVDDQDRTDFLRTALRLKAETPYSILAYCLMGNHFHFAIKVDQISLSTVMHRLLTAYVRGFNARHDRDGHLFQARYKAALCLDDRYLIALVRYIHQNPVRAGLVSRPGDWPWSSQREYAGRPASGLVDPTFFFDAANCSAGNVYGDDADKDFDPWPRAAAPSPLLRRESSTVESLDALAASLFPEGAADLRSGSRLRALTRRKSIVAKKAVEHGHTQVSIAAWMNCTPQAIHLLLKQE